MTKENELKIKETQTQLDELKKKCDEYLEGWKRERAGFLNYKKEEMERIAVLIRYSNEELILKMLPILDNFDIAEKNIPDDPKNNEHIKGILQIHQQMKDFLAAQGVKEIKSVGEKFDPNFHEAVEEVKPQNQESRIKNKESGIIVEETQKGYTLYGKVIRPAKVKVAK